MVHISPEPKNDWGNGNVMARIRQGKAEAETYSTNISLTTQRSWMVMCLFPIVVGLFLAAPFVLFYRHLSYLTAFLFLAWIWAGGWYLLNAWRAHRYQTQVWPGMRQRIDILWRNGWRPRKLHVQITACFELPELTRLAVFNLVEQIDREDIPTRIYCGTFSAYEEAIFSDIFEEALHGRNGRRIELAFIRLTSPGQVLRMGAALREIRRWGAEPEDLIVFLEDDTLLDPDLLQKTLPLFVLEKDLQAVATEQKAVCLGPRWVLRWLQLRFSQRRQALSSQALSGSLLPFSTRIRILRARQILNEGFIQRLERQSGVQGEVDPLPQGFSDDSITWCHLLSRKGKMIFVPDASVYSISLLDDADTKGAAVHLRRWSGQVMSKVNDVIVMGPNQVPRFIWWSVVQQRLTLAMVVLAPLLLFGVEMMSPGYAVFWMVLILLTRFCLGLMLLEQKRPLSILVPYVLCLTPLIHGVSALVIAASRFTQTGNPKAIDAKKRNNLRN